METILREPTFSSEYYGMMKVLEINKSSDLTIFVVDDNKAYLEALAHKLKANINFKVYTFLSGTECLAKLHLNPDLIIVDYHLDGNGTVKEKGDTVMQKIKEVKPDIEVVLISGDEKLGLLNLDLAGNYIQKDQNAFKRLKSISEDIFLHKVMMLSQNFLFSIIGLIILFIAVTISILIIIVK